MAKKQSRANRRGRGEAAGTDIKDPGRKRGVSVRSQNQSQKNLPSSTEKAKRGGGRWSRPKNKEGEGPFSQRTPVELPFQKKKTLPKEKKEARKKTLLAQY